MFRINISLAMLSGIFVQIG